MQLFFFIENLYM